MALPLIKKTIPVQPLPKLQKVFLAGSLLVLGAVLVAAGWLGAAEKDIQASLKAKNERLKQLDVEASATAQRLGALKRDLAALKVLLDGRVLPLVFLGFLEGVTVPDVRWRAVEVNVVEPRRLKLQGIAKTFESVAQQIERMRQTPEIGSFTLGRAALGSGGFIEFPLEIVPGARLWRQ